MKYGHYSIEFDRTGFPLIRREDWNYYISLFPVSKYQFERFMIENGPQRGLYTDKWYRELLSISPRRPWMMCDERQWELFLTGASYNEIKPFLKYLGSGFRLPQVKEWRELLRSQKELKDMKPTIEGLCRENCASPVSLWIRKELFLVEEGLLEMVMEGDEVFYIGKPYQGLLPNTWSPEEIRQVNWELCKKMIGFRVVKKEDNSFTTETQRYKEFSM